jgi:hypothetical protein
VALVHGCHDNFNTAERVIERRRLIAVERYLEVAVDEE